ncbi:MAG: hypothetical protein ACLVAT_00375 [Lachnospiraceae bacterium]
MEQQLADGDAVTAGVTLRITAEDGTTNDYTVAQKKYIQLDTGLCRTDSREMYGSDSMKDGNPATGLI